MRIAGDGRLDVECLLRRRRALSRVQLRAGPRRVSVRARVMIDIARQGPRSGCLKAQPSRETPLSASCEEAGCGHWPGGA
jgi:hypothetical protein